MLVSQCDICSNISEDRYLISEQYVYSIGIAMPKRQVEVCTRCYDRYFKDGLTGNPKKINPMEAVATESMLTKEEHDKKKHMIFKKRQ